MTRRSVLFSPGDQPELLRKAPATDADVIVFDLEDGVGPEQKSRAREAVAAAVTELDPEAELCVRVNPPGAGLRADLAALKTLPESVMLPKVSGPEDIAAVTNHRSVPVLALLETAAGVLAAERVARADPTDALVFGAEDLAADTGARRTTAGTEIEYARQRVVLAASAAGIDAIDTLFTDFEDTTGLERDATTAAEFGFDGKMAIHPGQVPVINDAFTPEPAQLAWATRVLKARAQTDDAVFAVDGEMIDAPLLARAERIRARAEAAGAVEAAGTAESGAPDCTDRPGTADSSPGDGDG